MTVTPRLLAALFLGTVWGSSSSVTTPSSYLAQFHPGTSAAVRAEHLAAAGAEAELEVTRSFAIGESFRGYAFSVRDTAAAAAVLARLRGSGAVKLVERDIALKLKRVGGGSRSYRAHGGADAPPAPPAPPPTLPAAANGTCVTQSNVPSWGLARITQASIKGGVKGDMRYVSGVGAGVDLFVMDTGVRVTHHEFGGRASFAFNAAGGKVDTDHDGHGTFVAGVAAAATYGVCKACRVRSVKVFTDGGDCSAAILIAGFQWIAEHHANKTRRAGNGTATATVINVSVGGDPGETSDAMDAAVNALVAMGVHVVGAAGNENVAACTESPSRAAGIVSVGSSMILTQTMDFFLGGSNFGKCVKLFAPGDQIVSIGAASDIAKDVVDSGTSFSSPHVAGALARLASQHPASSLAEVQALLLNMTLKGVIGGVPKGTANKLLHKACL